MINIVIVEDHEIFRKGVITLLEEIKDVHVSAEFPDALSFLAKLPEINPDIVFMDIKMAGMDGIEATRKAREIKNKLKVVALSMYGEEDYLQQMLEAGAMGFLLKNVNKNDLEKAIHSVVGGNRYFSEELMNILASKFLLNPDEASTQEIITFSRRELEVLQLICEGCTNVEIGEKLFLSNRTVDGHRAKMIEKAKAKNTVGLVMYAIKNKLVNI